MISFKIARRLPDGTREKLENCLHGSHSHSTMDIRGHWGSSGPQEIGVAGGVPQEIGDILAKYPGILKIVVVYEKGGSVWQRITEEPVETPEDPKAIEPLTED